MEGGGSRPKNRGYGGADQERARHDQERAGQAGSSQQHTEVSPSCGSLLRLPEVCCLNRKHRALNPKSPIEEPPSFGCVPRLPGVCCAWVRVDGGACPRCRGGMRGVRVDGWA